MKKKKRKADSDSDEEEEEETPKKSMDWKEAFRKKPRKQKVEAPIDPEAWADWTCSLKEGKVIEKAFSKLPAKNAKGMGILEIAEKIAELDKISSDKLKEKYKTSAGKDAKERWARVYIIAGIIASDLENED